MAKLMPTAKQRTCYECGYTFATAYPGAMACPFLECSAYLSAEADWPHTCAQGHGANHGGNCIPCAEAGK